jgi:hypothetical protein
LEGSLPALGALVRLSEVHRLNDLERGAGWVREGSYPAERAVLGRFENGGTQGNRFDAVSKVHYAGGPTVSMAVKRKGPQVLMKIQNLGHLFAEGKRFELLVRGYRTLVFKTSSFGRSDNLPVTVVFHRQLAATKTALLKHFRQAFR